MAIFVGIFVLFGWATDNVNFKGVIPGLVSMKTNAAIGILALGVSLYLLRSLDTKKNIKIVAVICGLIATFLGLTTFAEYLFGWELGIDQMLFLDDESELSSIPGRMALITSIDLILLGLAMTSLEKKIKSIYLSEILVLSVIIITIPNLLGYVYQSSELLTTFSNYTEMALHSVISMLVLAIGILCARPHRGIMETFSSKEGGGQMLRNVLPRALGALIFLSWLKVEGQEFGLYGDVRGTAYMITLAITVFAYFLWKNASLVNESNMLRIEDEKRVTQDQFFAVSLDLLAIASTDGFFKRLNPAFHKVLGFTSEELYAKPFIDFVHPEDTANTRKEVESLANGNPSISFENRYLCKDGLYKWFSWKISTVGKTLYCAARDITDQKNIQLELLHAKDLAIATAKMKSDFLANMSHEIRTPMNAIQGMTDLLLESELNNDQKNLAKIVQSSCSQLLTIINDVLDFSKIESGHLELEIINFNLTSLVETQADILGARAREKEISLMTFIDPTIPTSLKGDPSRIGQILLNFISNAIKFTHKGHITVRATPLERPQKYQNKIMVKFSVEDTGIGIPESVRHRLFQPFSQADSSTSRKFGGTGLGLSISKRLVEIMGGEIGVDSVDGKGATFWFQCELELDALNLSKGKSTPLQDLEKNKSPKILIVDDDPPSGEILMAYTKNWGMSPFRVEDATSGLNMLKMATAKDEPFDIVVIDRRMPVVDGFALADQIKSDVQLKETPMILITAFDRTGQLHEAVKHGFQTCLQKPIKQSELYNYICQGLNITSSKTMANTHSQVSEIQQVNEKPRRPEKILVAEDVVANQMLIMRYLEILGYDCHVVSNGQEVLNALDLDKFDLILMDCQMPGMDGYEATRKIRSIEKKTGQHISIIALTANAMREDRIMCMESGMDAVLVKPLKRNALEDFLTKWFKNTPQYKKVSG